MASNRIRVRAVRSLVTTIVSTALIITAALTPAAAQTPDKGKHMIDGVRDARYCELIPVVRRGIHLVATVYNTLGLNDCPPEVWDKITEAAMKKRFGALKVVLNGPRHFVMDAIAAAGDTAAGKTVDAEGLAADRAGDHQGRSLGAARKTLSRAHDRARDPLCVQGRQAGVPPGAAGRRALRHAVLRADHRQVAVL